MSLPANHPDTDFITMQSGVEIDPLMPELHGPGEITLTDIAYGLGNVCRYGGQCDAFFSVAEHSLSVAQLMRAFAREDHYKRTAPPELGDLAFLYGLFHDAPECLLGDTPRPIKRRMWWWKSIENKWDAIFKEQFNIPDWDLFHRWKEVADRMALVVEMDALKRENAKVYELIDDRKIEDYDQHILTECWESEEARTRWLAAYHYTRLNLARYEKENECLMTT